MKHTHKYDFIHSYKSHQFIWCVQHFVFDIEIKGEVLWLNSLNHLHSFIKLKYILETAKINNSCK